MFAEIILTGKNLFEILVIVFYLSAVIVGAMITHINNLKAKIALLEKNKKLVENGLPPDPGRLSF